MTSLISNAVKHIAGTETAPPQKNEAVMVAESLLCEVDFQIKEVENRKREDEKQLRRQKSGVDYSWLVSVQPKSEFQFVSLGLI